jgi:tetratricopeptide (TPR) repeat protein
MNDPAISKFTIQIKGLAFLLNFFRLLIFAIIFQIMMMSAPVFAKTINEVPEVESDALTSACPIFHDDILRGINLIFDDRFEESLVIFDRLQRLYPDHPAPYFFRAVTYQKWMSTFRVKKFQKDLNENIQLAIDKGNKLLEKENDPWLHFYVGGAYGYRAFNRFSNQDWITAYFDSKKGVNHFEKALEKEPELYDVYLGLGSYHYWRTAKSKFLRLIAFWMKDTRNLGIRQLEFSHQHSIYASREAGYNLMVAYVDDGQYEKASNLLQRIVGGKGTSNISDLYFEGRLFILFNRWVDAESNFRTILQHLEEKKITAFGYIVECKYWIAASLKMQNKNYWALQLAEEALAQSEKWNSETELESPFESFRDLKKQLKDLHKELKIENKHILVKGK